MPRFASSSSATNVRRIWPFSGVLSWNIEIAAEHMAATPALHVARAASVNQLALFRRADGCVLPVADTGHHVQMAAVFQNLVAFAEGRDEVRAVVAQILHLARDAFAVKDLLETERAALLVSRRVDGILQPSALQKFPASKHR